MLKFARLMPGLALGVMLSDTLISGLIFTVLPPVLPLIAQNFGSGDQGRFIAQLIMTMPSIGLMVAGGVNGWLVDRFGPRVILFLGLISFAVLGSAGLYLHDAIMFLASRLLLGFAASSITTATAWMLAESYEPAVRVRLLGFRNALGGLGGVLSSFLAGVVAESGGWRSPFAFYLLPLLILPVAVVALPRFDILRSREAPRAEHSVRALFPIFGIVVGLYVFVFATYTQLSFLLTTDGFSSPSTQSVVLGIGQLTSLLSAACYGPLRLRMSPRAMLMLLMFLMGAGDVIIGLSHTPTGAAAGIGVAGIGGGIVTPYFCNAVFDRSSATNRGKALGLLYSSMYLGDFLSPLVFHPMSLVLGLHGSFMLLGSLLVGGMLVVALRKAVSCGPVEFDSQAIDNGLCTAVDLKINRDES